MNSFLARNRVVEIDLALGAEFDGAVFQGEKGMVFAHADVFARDNVSTALADDD